MRKNTGKNRIKMFSVLAVMLMVLTSVCVIENTEEADAASNPYYKYVMTYSGETITQVDIYDSPSHITKTITTKNALDSFWAFDTTTGYGPFNSCYAAVNVSDGTVAFHMQPNNLKRQLGASSDMSSSELANYNIVWLIPTVYWSATSTTLTLTNSSTEGGTAYAHSVVSPTAKTYPFIGIGVYEASTATVGGNTALMSQSGKAPTVSQTVGTFDSYGQNTPGDAILWNFYHWTFTKMATYMVGMGKNTQQIWGAGLTSGSAAATTGLGDTAGAYSSGQTTYSKVFIENSWGSVYEWVGSTTFSSRTLYLTTTTGGNSNYGSTIGTSQGVNLPSSGWITGTSKASATWDLPTSSSSTSNSSNVAYPGDYVNSNTGVRVLGVGGSWDDGTNAGVSHAYGSSYSTGTSTGIGGRLAYYLDADAASTTTVTISPNTAGYGTVSQSTVSNIEIDSTITVNGNKLTFADGTEVTATPTTNTAAYSYAFTGWSVSNGAKVTEDMTITANFSRSDNYYDVTIAVSPSGYGTVNNQTTLTYNVIYGTTVSVDQSTKVLTVGSNSVTATPITDSTGQYTYYLDSWYNATGPITADQTITAVFDRSVNNYDVTVSVDPSGYGTVGGSSTKTVNVPYGTAITVNGSTIAVGLTEIVAAPITDQTGEYTYSFVNYTGTTATVTGNTSITANFTRAVNTFNLTFTATPTGYGTVSESQLTGVPWGTTVGINPTTHVLTLTSVDHSYSATVTPTPDSGDSQHYYTFGSWNVTDGQALTSATTITATFVQNVHQYTVTLAVSPNGYGTVSSNSLTVDYGTSISVTGNTLTIGSTDVTPTPYDDQTGQYTYTFVNWTGTTASVTGDMTITANFTRALNYYTVSIGVSPNGYGSVSQSQLLSVPWGTTITASDEVLTLTNASPVYSATITATPTVDSTGQYTYSFVNYTGHSGTVSGNTSITANFTRDWNTYTVTIAPNNSAYGEVNGQSSLSLVSVPWGTAITMSTATETNDTLTFSHSDPAYSQTVLAESTADTSVYYYTFNGWSISDNTVIVGNTSITANFTQEFQPYDVTVEAKPDGYGTVEVVGTITDVPYGSTMTISGNVLTVSKGGTTYGTITATEAESTVYYSYHFEGYEEQDVPIVSGTIITGDITITATFTEVLRNYILLIAPDHPEYGEVTEDELEVPAGSVINITTTNIAGDTLEVNNLSSVASVKTDSTGQYIYNFDGWSVSDDTEVVSNMEITAYFSATVREYTVTIGTSPSGYGTVDGSSSATVTDVPYGTFLTIGTTTVSGDTLNVGNLDSIVAAPVASDGVYVYAFDHWSVSNNTQVTGDTTVTAVFTRGPAYVDVTFAVTPSGYGTLSESVLTVPFNSEVTINQDDSLTINNVDVIPTPTVDSTGQYTYSFDGWSVLDGARITADTTITATFERELRTYNVTIASNNNSYGTVSPTTLQDVPYGTTVTIGTTVSTNDTLNFTNLEESYSQQVVATPSVGGAQYSYALSGWSISDNATITGTTSITATFTQSTNTYTVYFVTDGTEYGTVSTQSIANVPYNTELTVSGSTVTVGGYGYSTASPIAQDSEWTYEFDYWSYNDAELETGEKVVGNTTITANFDREKRSYTITWIIDNTLDYTVVEYGVVPTHADPSKANYTFAGWSPSLTAVTGPATYTATWTATQYTVIFNPQGGTVSPNQATGSVETPITAPLPVMPYYVCDGWYDENGILVAIVGQEFYPTQSMTVFAHWTAIEYTITFNGNGGTPTQAASVGSQSSPITLPSANLDDYSFFAWFDVEPTEAMIEAGESSSHFIGFRGSLYYPTKSMTVYAGWTDKTTFALSYDVNGGWYGPKTQSYSTDDESMETYTFKVTSDKPIWYAHTFMGWTTDLENPEVEYVAGDSITVNANATVVLHAVWIEGPAYGPFMNIMQLLPIIATIGLMISAVSYFILPRINAGATIKKVRR